MVDDSQPDAPPVSGGREAAIDQLIADAEIRQLAARYAVALDSRDLDRLVELFVPDVRVGAETGRAALRESFDTMLREIGVSILNVGTHAIELVDADHATGTVYCKGEIQDGDRWIHQAIAYEDRYARVDGVWLFVRRIHRLFYGVPVEVNPMTLAAANWPEHPDGRGTVPEIWPTWQDFWKGSPDRPAGDTMSEAGSG
jgi:SnoaL-like domain